ncbi:MAG TPA: serine/threonine-protein kinase [Verrucomicrobiae bacterium]
MNSEQPRESSPQEREATLFEAALDKSCAEREAFLKEAAGDDEQLQSRLKALLAAHEQEDGALAEPAEAVRHLRKPDGPDPSPDEAVGHTVGRYKLLEKIGEGGCGVVYVAEQTEPVRRRVALKVIKLGMDTKAVVARFEAERQALALMDHPNIAKVFDAGSTETGRPYFVMELVSGARVTNYCDQNRLPTRDRLKLFIQVCHAIQHAHQKGIIHRDIKPSNILVAVQDGVPDPKVIDFGIAKATEGRLAETTIYTQLHQLIGTPTYMSPEQADMTSADVDTRSDIYSLGVLLYELLTGRTPFDTQALLAGGIDALRRTIRETEPMRPSTRLATLKEQELTIAAKRRSAEPPKLISLLKGDLDWVVMRCLEKDRSKRYETANGLAADLERHLRNEPVVARPPRRVYRFRKSLQRNKLFYAAGATVMIALAGGLGTAVYTLNEEKASRRRAETAEQDEVRLRQQSDRREETTRRNLYAVDMNLAELALRRDNFHRASDLLERHRPAPNRPDLRHWEWRYLWQFCRGDEHVTLGYHTNVVTCIAVAPDGKRLVSGGYDGNVQLWDLASGQLIASVKPAGTYGVIFSPDGKRLAAATEHGVSVWESDSLRLLASLDVDLPIRALSFMSDDQRLAFFRKDGVIRVWDLATNHPVTNFPGTRLSSSLRGALVFSPRGDLLAVGEQSGLIRLLDPLTGAEKGRLVGHHDSVTGLAFAPTGLTLASSSWDRTARLWDVASRQEKLALTNHTAWVSSVAFAPDGYTLATSSADQSIRIWDATSGRQLALLKGHRGEVRAVTFSRDGRYLISGGKDEAIKIWPAAQSPSPSMTNALPERVNVLALSPDGRYVALLTADHRLTLGDPVTRQPLWQLTQKGGHFSALAFAPWEPILATGDSLGRIEFLDVSTGRQLRQFTAHTNGIVRLHFSADGRSLCSLDQLAIYKRWDIGTGFEDASGQLSEPPYDLLGVDFSSDHHRLVFASHGRLHVLSLGATNEPFLFPLQKDYVHWAAFAPDGRHAATAAEDGTARLWDTAGPTQPVVLHGHRLGIYVVAFSPDGRRLLSGGGENDVKLWDLESGQEVFPLEPTWSPEETSRVSQLGFSPDGDTVWVINGNLRWQLWHAPSFEEIFAAEQKPDGAQPRAPPLTTRYSLPR